MVQKICSWNPQEDLSINKLVRYRSGCRLLTLPPPRKGRRGDSQRSTRSLWGRAGIREVKGLLREQLARCLSCRPQNESRGYRR
ncbi:hypothetical protein CEXT_135941 [Caerostris extrusa]|uniref:Uncharacterized protein n=1 Tax=Caerostris extrusa TaxID=172846 RepID=A0AAV4PPE3_CAEEX|nr:hypothetical protein CEXT_135941 [Caerostris extrusa]